MSATRPTTVGKTRACPHCKATILESVSICPGCQHHLRFDSAAAQRQAAAESALRVEGTLQQPADAEPQEYSVVISIRNQRGEEVTRQVVGVGALQPLETRTFTLSVDVLPTLRPTPPAPRPTPPQRPSSPIVGNAPNGQTLNPPSANGARSQTSGTPSSTSTTSNSPFRPLGK